MREAPTDKQVNLIYSIPNNDWSRNNDHCLFLILIGSYEWSWLWPGFHSRRSWTKMASVDNKQWQKDAADQNFDYMFKLLIIGNSAVGKTSFLFRYADDSFTSAFVSTVGIDFKVKTVFRNDKRVKLQIWDTGLTRIWTIWNCTSVEKLLILFLLFFISWTRKISHYNNGILPWRHGIYTYVRYHEWGVFPSGARLVGWSTFFDFSPEFFSYLWHLF